MVLDSHRGTHNRGTFAKDLAKAGVQIRQIGVEAHEQLGRTERHGGIFKRILARVVLERKVRGGETMKMAAAQVIATKNEMSRHGGFSPSQWVLSKLPRAPLSQMDTQETDAPGSHQALLDAQGAFAERMRLREAARETLMREDCSQRISRALLRNAPREVGHYKVGDLISLRVDQGAATAEERWSTAARVIGQEGKGVLWVLCEGTPYCVATNRVRPVLPHEALAYQYLHPMTEQERELQEQGQRYVDLSQPLPEEELGRTSSPSNPEEGVKAQSSPTNPEEGVKAQPRGKKALPSEPAEGERESQRRRIGESLLRHWRATGEIGEGVAMIERRESYVVFMAWRADTPGTQRYKRKNADKEPKGATLQYRRADEYTKRATDESRKVEWQKWKHFHAAIPIEGKDLEELVKEGHEIYPTAWVDVDKNFHRRVVEGQDAPLLATEGIRRDAPTCEQGCLNLLISWAASTGLRLKSVDISNAYFQGPELDRVMLLRPPAAGLPDPDIGPGTHLMARVPIYGSGDAGRHFWKKLRTVALEAGMKESALSPAFYHHSAEGSVQAMLGTHVDDILFATKEGQQGMVDKILAHFETKEVAEGKFRFCGKEIEQDESGSVRVTCRDTTLNISQINFRTEGRSKSDKANEGEVAQLRSVIGSVSWIARQC